MTGSLAYMSFMEVRAMTDLDVASFVNLTARVGIETHRRRRRIERLSGQNLPRILRHLFANYEQHIVARMSSNERADYFAGKLGPDFWHELLKRPLPERAPTSSPPQNGAHALEAEKAIAS
jgi:hypothetical protein